MERKHNGIPIIQRRNSWYLPEYAEISDSDDEEQLSQEMFQSQGKFNDSIHSETTQSDREQVDETDQEWDDEMAWEQTNLPSTQRQPDLAQTEPSESEEPKSFPADENGSTAYAEYVLPSLPLSQIPQRSAAVEEESSGEDREEDSVPREPSNSSNDRRGSSHDAAHAQSDDEAVRACSPRSDDLSSHENPERVYGPAPTSPRTEATDEDFSISSKPCETNMPAAAGSKRPIDEEEEQATKRRRHTSDESVLDDSNPDRQRVIEDSAPQVSDSAEVEDPAPQVSDSAEATDTYGLR